MANRRLNVEEHGQTVRQHRQKLSEQRPFVTWMFGDGGIAEQVIWCVFFWEKVVTVLSVNDRQIHYGAHNQSRISLS
jgi:hypothetical protein